jgi:hypothetical protein
MSVTWRELVADFLCVFPFGSIYFISAPFNHIGNYNNIVSQSLVFKFISTALYPGHI